MSCDYCYPGNCCGKCEPDKEHNMLYICPSCHKKFDSIEAYVGHGSHCGPFIPPSTETLLAERGTTHGDFEITARVWNRYRIVATHSDLTEGQKLALDMIFLKIARITCGRPDFKDHWDDIAGYAKLASERCK